MTAPIWKDRYVTFEDKSSVLFRIRMQTSDGRRTIYEGKSYARPGETDVRIRINDICADFFKNTLPSLSQQEFSSIGFPILFFVETYDDTLSQWVTVDMVNFINDWSYDSSYEPSIMGMSMPINGRIDLRQWLMFTSYEDDTVTALVTLQDGSSFSVLIPIEIEADFNNDFNQDFARLAISAGCGTVVFRPSLYGDVKSMNIGGKVYDVVTDCKEWVLYYINAYGGWDSLLIEGLTLEQDDLQRHSASRVYDNGNVSNRGRENYANEITKKYTMHTGFMSDDESGRMHHLLNATTVYLYHIGTNEMLPVVLENNTTDYKTFKSNGGRMVNYSITASLAQDRMRR